MQVKNVILNLTINFNVLHINRLYVGQRDGGRDEVRGVLLLQGTDTVTHLHTHILSPRWMSRGQTPPSWTLDLVTRDHGTGLRRVSHSVSGKRRRPPNCVKEVQIILLLKV